MEENKTIWSDKTNVRAEKLGDELKVFDGNRLILGPWPYTDEDVKKARAVAEGYSKAKKIFSRDYVEDNLIIADGWEDVTHKTEYTSKLGYCVNVCRCNDIDVIIWHGRGIDSPENYTYNEEGDYCVEVFIPAVGRVIEHSTVETLTVANREAYDLMAQYTNK